MPGRYDIPAGPGEDEVHARFAGDCRDRLENS
jgi:hypothetical protein